ncbi:hypothetical protein Taro_009590 [Colocasia esculenta]|uniref:Retrotransposon gag domain-containing protein n=1 Tax=Colocasia esculenta TaxID=4460 RepID=A0A843U0U9_COLES|nr:hypothetical protein [Colocasia esculenta]
MCPQDREVGFVFSCPTGSIRWWSGECHGCLAGCASCGSASLASWFPLSGEGEADCVPSSSAFLGLLGVVVLSHGIWCHVAHRGDLCGEGPSPSAVLRLSWSLPSCALFSLWYDSALVVGGPDTSSRHWSPASPFPVPHSREPGPGSPEVSGMGLRPCGPQVVLFYKLLVLFTAFVPVVLVCSVLGEFPTEPVTSEAHPYPHSLVSLARLQPVRGRQTRIKYVIGLTGLAEAFRHSWYQSKKISGMADRRDWGGRGDDPEEITQRMIERIWESLTDIRARMDQQAPVPPVAVPPWDGEAVPVAPVPPRVEVLFAAPVPPPPPVLIAEEPVMQVEKFLRLNPDTAEHWVHEIEMVFATMRCPTADRVVLAAYQLRGFALEWWRLKMQTTFVGRTEEAITWSEFLDVKCRVGPEMKYDLLQFSWSWRPGVAVDWLASSRCMSLSNNKDDLVEI